MRKFYLILLALSAAFIMSGCTGILLNVPATFVDARCPGPDGVNFSDGASRASVIKRYGTPFKTRTFTPPISVVQARKCGVIPLEHIDNCSFFDGPKVESGVRIARVDEFRIRGPIASPSAGHGLVSWNNTAGSAAYWTLGISEIYYFPLAVGSFVFQLGCVTHLYVLYSPTDTFIYQRGPLFTRDALDHYRMEGGR